MRFSIGSDAIGISKMWAAFIAMLLMAGFAGAYIYAELAVYTDQTPGKPTGAFLNNTVLNFTGTGSVPLINITTNHSWEQAFVGTWNISMYVQEWNGTNVLNDTRFYLQNVTDAYILNISINTSSWAGYAIKPRGDGTNWYRIAFAFNDTIGNGNVTWSNSTAGGYYYFRYIEQGEGRINITNTLNSIVNGTVFSSSRISSFVNLTTNTTAANCFRVVTDDTTVTTFTQGLLNSSSGLANGTSTSQRWINNTLLVLNTSTAGKGWHNITYYCNDAWGNRTYMNTSVNNFSAYIKFKADALTPVIVNQSWMFENTSSSQNSNGNLIRVRFNGQDDTANYCGIRIRMEGYSINSTNVSTLMYQAGEATSNNTVCDFNVTPGYFFIGNGPGGNLTLTQILNDSVVDRAVTENATLSTNLYAVALRLRKGWNPVAFFENTTLNSTLTKVANLSQSAVFGNPQGNKTFMVHVSGFAARAGIQLYHGWNASYVYSEVDQLIVFNHTPTPIRFANASVYTGGANLIPVLRNNISINQTLAYTVYNITGGAPGVNLGIVAVSVYRPDAGANGKWCAGVLGFATTSCGAAYTTRNTTAVLGQAMWVHVNMNGTLNTTRFDTV